MSLSQTREKQERWEKMSNLTLAGDYKGTGTQQWLQGAENAPYFWFIKIAVERRQVTSWLFLGRWGALGVKGGSISGLPSLRAAHLPPAFPSFPPPVWLPTCHPHRTQPFGLEDEACRLFFYTSWLAGQPGAQHSHPASGRGQLCPFLMFYTPKQRRLLNSLAALMNQGVHGPRAALRTAVCRNAKDGGPKGLSWESQHALQSECFCNLQKTSCLVICLRKGEKLWYFSSPPPKR